MVKLTDLNINKYLFLNFGYVIVLSILFQFYYLF